jgi:hypothetical protein
LKKQWIPDKVRNDKNTNMPSFANYDTASLPVVVDFKTPSPRYQELDFASILSGKPTNRKLRPRVGGITHLIVLIKVCLLLNP